MNPPYYATLDEVKGYLPSTVSSSLDGELEDSIQTASRDIDKACGRTFWQYSPATTRLFYPKPDRWGTTVVDDFWTDEDLVVESGDGTFTTLTSSQYELQPLNGVVDGELGWPYYKIRAVNTSWVCGSAASLRITAQWGWAAVPPAIKTSCVLLAVEAFKLAREAPFGVAGFGVDGVVRIRSNARVRDMLSPYMRDALLVA